jgi:hypothetical protein
MHGVWLFVWLIGVVAFGSLTAWAFLSRPSRIQRRRRKNQGRVVSKVNRPMVRFNAKPPKQK